MFKKSLLGMALSVAACTLAYGANPPPTIKADAPNRYVVQKGDTLWGIAGKYLDAPYRWREIWATNTQIKNPNLIYPKDVLILCIIQDQTLVGVDTGEGCAGIERHLETTKPTTIPEPVPVAPVPISITAAADAIPTIPTTSIKPWLGRRAAVDDVLLKNTPYILAAKGGNLLTAQGNTVYAKGYGLIAGQTYGIYRQKNPYIDVQTGENIATEIEQVATVRVASVSSNGVSALEVLKTYDTEVLEGDRVLAELGNDTPAIFYPEPASVTRGGQVIRTEMAGAGVRSVITVNLGAREGASAGGVLDVFAEGKVIVDPQDGDMPVRLPSERIGRVMIFKTFDRLSYAYVLEAYEPINVGNLLLPPNLAS